jgi:phosphate transport system substrate-binding protein
MKLRLMGHTARVACAAAAVALTFPAYGQILINGAGATFPAPIYKKWFSEYQSVDSSANINYQAVGSGAGINQVSSGIVDFGASDAPMTDEQIGKAKMKLLHFPTVMGAVVATYNIPGVTTNLNFTGEVLAGIFLGKITMWNDPQITKLNPGISLPADKITTAHRADSSGTTYAFTDYLSAVSPEWKNGPGKGASVNWPGGLASKGSDGVTGLVKQQKNSIGYVELIYAVHNKLPFAKIKNQAGEFMLADLHGVTLAAAAKPMPADFRVSIVNEPGKGVYPISTFTWLLIPEQISDPAKKKVIVGFLKWMLEKGQTYSESLDYAPLPKAVVAQELKAIDKIK